WPSASVPTSTPRSCASASPSCGGSSSMHSPRATSTPPAPRSSASSPSGRPSAALEPAAPGAVPYHARMDVVTRSSTPATGTEHHGHDERPSGPTTTRRASSRPPWLAPAVVGAAALGGCALVYALNPVEEGNPPICPFKMMTGMDCPGCGATRSVNALLRGHPGIAADHNLLLVVALPVAV